MVRHAAWVLFVLFGFAATAFAGHKTLPQDAGLGDSLLSDLAFQQAIVTSAPDGVFDTPGADVWWAPFDGAVYKVMVLPGSAKGKPGCCLHLELDGTDFWIRITEVVLAASGSGSGGGAATSAAAKVGSPGSESENVTDPSWVDEPLTLAASALPDGDGSVGASIGIAQLPEPSLLVLLAMSGLAAARSRGRRAD